MGLGSIEPDEIISPRGRNIKFHFLKRISPFSILLVILALMVLKGIFYTIEPNEVGVVLRLGKFVRTTPPGLHFKLPLGIERVYPVKVEYIFKEEFGFRTHKPGIRTVYEAKSSYKDESLMLTGDLNVLDVEWIVQFKIKDPFKALFNVRKMRKTLRDLSESMMRKVIGDYTFNEVLTKRMEINNLVQEGLQKVLDSYDIGVKIITVKLQDVNPPDSVKPAFNEVNEAKQEREKMINQAWETYNKKIPQAKGEALKMIKQAEGYALEKINRAQGEAKRFLLVLESYNQAKEVTLRRLYLENMNEILNRAGKKYIIDSQEKGVLPLLRLER